MEASHVPTEWKQTQGLVNSVCLHSTAFPTCVAVGWSPPAAAGFRAVPRHHSMHIGCVFRVGFPRGRPAGGYTCLPHRAGGRPYVRLHLLAAHSLCCPHLCVFRNASGLYVPMLPFTAQECGALTAGVPCVQDSRGIWVCLSAHGRRGLDCQSHLGNQCQAPCSRCSSDQKQTQKGSESHSAHFEI